MFTPKWKKEVKLVLKHGRKYLHYKKDILKPEKIAEIEEDLAQLETYRKEGNKEACQPLNEKIQNNCNFVRGFSKFEAQMFEQVEVFFVAFIIALAIRTYVVQPFNIPTGSMQPTLNGIRGYEIPMDQWPSTPTRWISGVAEGKSFKELTLQEDDYFLGMKDGHFLFVQWADLYFEKKGRVRVWGASSSAVLHGLGFGKTLFDAGCIELARQQPWGMGYLTPAPRSVRVPVKANQKLYCGMLQSGDLVLVDKMSYHFRHPKRGEVFVFDTRDIEGTLQGAKGLRDQAGGEHYIKRLAGVPGDTLQIKDLPPVSQLQIWNNDVPEGRLYVNGQLATGYGFDLVHSKQGEYNGYRPMGRLAPGQSVTLKPTEDPMLAPYFPLGDNSRNSLDGRYWFGPDSRNQEENVRGYNVVGPALFSLWPMTSHWGIIR